MILLRYAGIIRSFFFNDTATTEIYTLSLHDALPICAPGARAARRQDRARASGRPDGRGGAERRGRLADGDRKSTRLNSSHTVISYAVFCLKKKKIRKTNKYRMRKAAVDGAAPCMHD